LLVVRTKCQLASNGGREWVEKGCEMSINPNESTANIKLFELCEPPQREVKHSAKTPKSEIRRTAMFTKISRPTVEGAAK